jgi:SnoaL-like protein
LDNRQARRDSPSRVNFLREEYIMAGAATTMLGRLMERNVSEVFSERDPGRRRRVIAELYAEDCAFYDAEGKSIGQGAISDHVGHILDKGPPGFAFRVVGPAEVIHDLGRLRWQMGPEGAPAVVSGMDVAVFANGKIGTLYTFIEPPVSAEP